MTRIAALAVLALCLGCPLLSTAVAENAPLAEGPTQPAGFRNDLQQDRRFAESPQSLWGIYRKSALLGNSMFLNKRGCVIAVRGKVEQESEGRFYIAVRF